MKLFKLILGFVSLLAVAACGNVAPTAKEVAPYYVASVTIDSSVKQNAVEAVYGGKVIVFKPEAGFAVLGFDKESGELSTLVTEENLNALSSPEVAAQGQSAWASGYSAWASGYSAWASGFSAWAGGYKAWAGGQLTGTPIDNYNYWQNIGLPEAHQALAPKLGAGIVVAVLDTGVDSSHPALGESLVSGYDFVDNDNNPVEIAGGSSYGHGTAVAGIILQVAPKAKIMPIRVLDSQGLGDTDNVAEAIIWAVDNGARVINLSLGSELESKVLRDMLEYASEKGVYIISSAGNEGQRNNLTFPAREGNSAGFLGRYMVSVGSVNDADIKSTFSNYGKDLELLAPGEGIFTLAPEQKIAYVTGTSFSAPFVSGTVALALAQGVQEGFQKDFSKYLGDFADDIKNLSGNHDFRKELGKGRLNLAHFLRGIELTDYADSFKIIPQETWDLNFAYKTGDVKLKIYSASTSYNQNAIDLASIVLQGQKLGQFQRPTEIKVNNDNLELVFKDIKPQLLNFFKNRNIQPGSAQSLTLAFALLDQPIKGYPVSIAFSDGDKLWINYAGGFTVVPQSDWEQKFLTDNGSVDIKIFDATGAYNAKHINPASILLKGPGGQAKPYQVDLSDVNTRLKFYKNQLWQLLGVGSAPSGTQFSLSMSFALNGGAVNDYPVVVTVK